MKEEMERRVLRAAEIIAQTGATVRTAAGLLGVSKSTVHQDVTLRLPEISPALAKETAAVLRKNKAERHLRGGEATRKRYAARRAESQTPDNSI